jgi:hypothetical protein
MRPTSRIINLDKPLPDYIVIKRSHSDANEHILLPNNLRRTKEYLMANLEIQDSVWYGQTYIPLLERLGEWRVLMVGGRIMYVVHTLRNKNGTWKCDIVQNYYSLAELRYFLLTVLNAFS